jgi:hypothetical protein
MQPESYALADLALKPNKIRDRRKIKESDVYFFITSFPYEPSLRNWVKLKDVDPQTFPPTVTLFVAEAPEPVQVIVKV